MKTASDHGATHLPFKFCVSLVLCLCVISKSEAGTTLSPATTVVPTKRPTAGSSDETTITSIERPPIHRTLKSKARNNTDESGVTYPPKNSYQKSGKLRSFLNRISFTRIKNWRKLFLRIKHVHEIIAQKRSHEVGQGRVMESWMEGAMVPMTFLLMAAFIMDILQRLFPLPYAAFVQQQWAGSEHYPTVAATPKEPELTKFQMKTPLGSFGIETNDKKKINLFGRSNLGNPPVVPAGNAEGNTELDSYIQNLFGSNNTAQPLPVISDYDGLTYSSGLGDYGGGLVVPTADGTYDLGADWPSDGEGWSSLPIIQTGDGGYGLPGNTQSEGTGGYGSGNNNNGTAAADQGNQGGYGYSPPAAANNDPLAGGSSISTSIDQLPISTMDLVEYYSKLERENNNLWKRKKRLTVLR